MSIRLARARDQDWFRALYHENYRPLLAYARRRVDWATAEEVVADTFLTAWRRRDDIPDGHERTWLFGVARNTMRNAARAARRQRGVRERLRGLPKPALADSAPADSSSEGVDERASVLRAALSGLSEADREMLMLVAWEELSYDEIGQMLDLTPNAVAIRVHRARQRLAKHVARLTADREPVKDHRGSGHQQGTDPGQERRAL
ncbi:MAG: RNA polymerase sigma factor [bacterium]|nr:RNA polymerase sigma factor [bacterium]